MRQKDSAKASASSSTLYDKIVAENEQLVKDYKKEISKNERLQVSLSRLQVQYEALSTEVERVNKTSTVIKVPPTSPHGASKPGLSSPHSGASGGREELEVKVEELQAEVEKKTTMLMEVKRLLREAAERERELKSVTTDSQVLQYLSMFACTIYTGYKVLHS